MNETQIAYVSIHAVCCAVITAIGYHIGGGGMAEVGFFSYLFGAGLLSHIDYIRNLE